MSRLGPWRPVTLPALAADLAAAAGPRLRRPRIIAIDGRGGSGKTTLAAALAEELGATVVHADDLAWHEPLFGWRDRLDELLTAVRAGDGVSYRPPQWRARGREDAIEVPAGCPVVVVEGTGASQSGDSVDVVVWVQADADEAERRGIARDLASGVNGDEEETVAFWRDWMAHEVPFLARERPWEQAYAVVAGTPVIALSEGEWAVADGPLIHPGQPALTAGEWRIVADAASDDVSLDWVLRHLRLDAVRPGPDDWDAAFASLGRLLERGLVAVGRWEDAPDGGLRHVPEPVGVVRARVDAWGEEWAYAGWVVSPAGAEVRS